MSTCPTCRQEIPLEPGVVRVTPETVQDLRDIWQADHHGLITQRILFATVTKETTDETQETVTPAAIQTQARAEEETRLAQPRPE